MDEKLSMDDQFLDLIRQVINDNLDNEHFSVEELAEKAGLSRSMLHRNLIKLTGKSATDLITETRLNKAKELLEKDVATVSEISYRVGFNSPSYFNKVFKKYFRVSPGEMKKKYTAGSDQLAPEPDKVSHSSDYQKLLRTGIIVLLALVSVAIIGGGIYYISQKTISAEKSIAILPFDNLSSEEENQYFADGVVEDLLNRLSTIGGLKVISRTSSEMFRDKGDKTVPEIAEILGVTHILEGSVQRDADNIRISVQLIDADRDDHMYSKQYDRKVSEVFKMQSEIASRIVSELSIILTDQQQSGLQRNQIHNMEAFNYYQIGQYHYCNCSKEETLTSIDYFNKAIQVDSNFALAWAGLANSYCFMTWNRWIDDEKKGRDTTIYLALKALEIDENLAEAHSVLGYLYREIDCNMFMAEQEFLKAIELNPNSSIVYKDYSRLLSLTGRHEKAREYISKAIILDPFSFPIRNHSATVYYFEGFYDKALEENLFSLKLVKDHPYATSLEFIIFLGLENEAKALESFIRHGSLTGKYSVQEAESAYKANGIEGLLRIAIRTENWEVGKANYYALLGEYDKAIEILEKALIEGRLRPWHLYQINTRNFKSNPRFLAIKKKLGLGDY